MVNIGEIAEIVNSEHVTLEVGADNYILLDDLDIAIHRTENRSPTTGAGPCYNIGQGDNFFTATFLVTTPELSTLNALTVPDSNGDMTETAWKIVATDVSGNSKTFAATGYLRDIDFHKNGNEAKSTIDIFVRITGDTVTIT